MTTPQSLEAQRLLNLVADVVLEHGVTELSLSRVSRAIGSNNRMLLYYFESKDQLFSAALGTIYDRYPRLHGLMDLLDSGDDALQLLPRAWRELRDEENRTFMTLFFESYARAVRDPADHRASLESITTLWPAHLGALFRRYGSSTTGAEQAAVQVLALWRGMQLLLLSGMPAATLDAAHDTAIAALCAQARTV